MVIMLFDIIFFVYYGLILSLQLFVSQYVFMSVLQFESYYISRFVRVRFGFVIKNYLTYFLMLILTFISIFFLKYNHLFLSVFLILITLLLSSIFYIKQMKYSPLVFTKRIIRLMVSTFIFDTVFVVLSLLFINVENVVFFNIINLLISLLIMIFSFYINLPIEKLIANRYIKSARNKLNENKNLIKIGITGSYGKTTVKEILTKILSTQFSTISTPKSYNTTLGISKTINDNLKSTTEVFVCEMGAKKSGEILELCNLVAVDIGILTAVGNQHIETFKSINSVYNTKKELPDFLHNKLCVFNLMNPYTRKMYGDFVGNRIGVFLLSKKSRLINSVLVKKAITAVKITGNRSLKKMYLFPIKNNYYAKSINLTENGAVFTVCYSGKNLGKIRSNLLGVHNVLNMMLAISIAVELGVSFEKIKIAIESIKSINARLDKYITTKGAIVINNGYNSNIDSAKSTLAVLRLFKDKIKVVITPGLVETGDDFSVNRKFAAMVGAVADEVIIVKDKNRDAIILGLSDACFDISKVYSVKSFSDARGVIDIAGNNYVFLIENDLPDNYK